MFCSKCGNQINQGEKFCSSCGNLIEIIEPTQPKIEISKSPETKKQVNKKVIVPIAIIVSMIVVGLISLVVYLGATAPEREMKKALETNDCYTVITAFDNLMADGKYGLAHQMIVDYINDATDYLNNNFTLSVNDITEDDEIYEEIMWFLYENYGNMFVIVDEYGNFDESSLFDIEQFYEYEVEKYSIELALDNLSLMIASKGYYYNSLFAMNNYDEELEIMDCIILLDGFNSVISDDVNYDDAQGKAEEVYNDYINSLISKADEYMATGDYSAAIELINNAVGELNEEFPDNDLTTKFNEVLSTYAAQYATKAEEEFKNGDIDAAIGNIEAAISIYPNGEYEAKLEEYKLYLPLELNKSKNALEYDDVVFRDIDIISNNNIEMKNCFRFRVPRDYDKKVGYAGSVTYKLYGKYDVVTGIIFVSKEDKNYEQIGYFEAYGDGKLIYTSPKAGKGILPQDISFSVEGVHTLEIKYYGYETDGGFAHNPSIYISNFVAKKNIPTETTE